MQPFGNVGSFLFDFNNYVIQKCIGMRYLAFQHVILAIAHHLSVYLHALISICMHQTHHYAQRYPDSSVFITNTWLSDPLQRLQQLRVCEQRQYCRGHAASLRLPADHQRVLLQNVARRRWYALHPEVRRQLVLLWSG